VSADMYMNVCVYIHTVARSNSCKNVVLRGSGSYFLTTRASQMSVEAASDVLAKSSPHRYFTSPCGRRVGRLCVGVYSNICVVAR